MRTESDRCSVVVAPNGLSQLVFQCQKRCCAVLTFVEAYPNSMQMSTTFTGMAPMDKEGVRAAANLPLWKNVLFSAIGGVVGVYRL